MPYKAASRKAGGFFKHGPDYQVRLFVTRSSVVHLHLLPYRWWISPGPVCGSSFFTGPVGVRGRIRASLVERPSPDRLRARGWLGGHLATVEHSMPVWNRALRRSTKDSRMRAESVCARHISSNP